MESEVQILNPCMFLQCIKDNSRDVLSNNGVRRIPCRLGMVINLNS